MFLLLLFLPLQLFQHVRHVRLQLAQLFLLLLQCWHRFCVKLVVHLLGVQSRLHLRNAQKVLRSVAAVHQVTVERVHGSKESIPFKCTP